MTDPYDFLELPDLASRALAGSVLAANDELFAERENLIKPGPPSSSPDFGNKGKIYDGWETRRRREPGNDWAVVRLGVPGVVRGVVIDTSHFTGNYPPEASVEGAEVDGYPIRVTSSTGYPCWLAQTWSGTRRMRSPCPHRRGSRTCGCRSTRTVASPGSASTASAARTPVSSPAPSTWRRPRTVDACSTAQPLLLLPQQHPVAGKDTHHG